MHPAEIYMYLGGTRSGKSAKAEAKVHQLAHGMVFYVATSVIRNDDDAMQERIHRHRVRRPSTWQTLEYPTHIGVRLHETLQTVQTTPPPTILLDCVPLWIANLLFTLPDEESLTALEDAVEKELEALLTTIRIIGGQWVIVSGEVGLGGIAATRLGRNYADALGMANQRLAEHAHEAWLVVAGRQLALM